MKLICLQLLPERKPCSAKTLECIYSFKMELGQECQCEQGEVGYELPGSLEYIESPYVSRIHLLHKY